jgi:hypothetical protein
MSNVVQLRGKASKHVETAERLQMCHQELNLRSGHRSKVPQASHQLVCQASLGQIQTSDIANVLLRMLNKRGMW